MPKYIERSFAIMKAQFCIIRKTFELWLLEDIAKMAAFCAILHNFIVTMDLKGSFQKGVETEGAKFDIKRHDFDDEENMADER